MRIKSDEQPYWRFDRDQLALLWTDPHIDDFKLGLANCNTLADVLWIILLITYQPWATDACIASLVHIQNTLFALEGALEDMRGTVGGRVWTYS